MSDENKTAGESSKTGAAIPLLGVAAVAMVAAVAVGAIYWTKPAAQQSTEVGMAAAGLPQITVYKSPTCGCCTEWEKHLETAGFQVNSSSQDSMMPIKQQFGVPPGLASCHTAVIDGYVIEGHVPADDIKRLLQERPRIAGLTAPGMPQHSPGMQPPGEKPRGYDVLAFDSSGATRVFAQY